MKEILREPVLLFIALSIVLLCTSVGSASLTMVVFMITVTLILIKDGQKPLHNSSVVLFMCFVMVVFFYSLFGKGTLNEKTQKTQFFFFFSLFSCLLISYHLKTLNSKQITGLLKIALIALLFSLIGTTAVSYIDPMAVRLYGFGEVEGVDLKFASTYYSMGMMTYSLAHAMAVVVTGLCVLMLKIRSVWVKILLAAMLVMIIRLLFIMTITTALLCAVIVVVVVFADHFSKGRTIMTISLSLIVFAVFLGAGYATIIVDYASDTDLLISDKLSDFFSFAESGVLEGQAEGRSGLYKASLKTFSLNPILGLGSDNGSRRFIGEHSFLFDYLAYYGLFALLLFGSIWKEYKSLKPYLSDKRNTFYYALIPLVIMVSFKAIAVCGSCIFMSLIFLQLVFLHTRNISNE